MFKIKIWIYRKLVSQAKFRKWLELEDIRSQIKEASDKQDNEAVSNLICSYLSDALCSGDWKSLPWEQIMYNYAFCLDVHSPRKKHKIFSAGSENKEIFKVNDSDWYSWSHILAKKYGWELEYISKLAVDEALGFIQEILYEEQLEKEWEWALSEKSVHYDPNTKKSKFKPLERPAWLRPVVEVKEPKKEVIPTSMLPMGVVMKWDGKNVVN